MKCNTINPTVLLYLDYSAAKIVFLIGFSKFRLDKRTETTKEIKYSQLIAKKALNFA